MNRPIADPAIKQHSERVLREDVRNENILPVSWCIHMTGVVLLIALLGAGPKYVLGQAVKTVVAIDSMLIGIDLNIAPDLMAQFSSEAMSMPERGGIIPPGGYPYGGPKGKVELDQEQVDNLEKILESAQLQEATRPEMEALVVAVLQESSARVSEDSGTCDDDGSNKSGGFLQQRPDADWGTCAQVNDTDYAVRAFFEGAGTNEGLRDKGDFGSESIGEMVQSVQASAHPDAYEKWEPTASAILDEWLKGASAIESQVLEDTEDTEVVEEVPPKPRTAQSDDVQAAQNMSDEQMMEAINGQN